MITHDVPQNTPAWLKLRSQYPTASEFSNLVSPAKLKVCEGKAVDSYVAQKLAEAWQGFPMEGFSGFAMEQGKILEEEARPWYALEMGVDVETPGFITDDAHTMACSPDGFVPSLKRGLEIKCPEAPTHVKWIVDGGLPRDHLLQVQGGMLVCECEEWHFVSYRRGFPQLVVPVKRDRNVCDALEEAIGIYWEKYRAGWAKLMDANGGEGPSRRWQSHFDEDGAEVRTLSDDPILEILEK